MGRRSNDWVDEPTDAALQRALKNADESSNIQPPPDLVTRTLRRLPPVPPAVAARAEARRHTQRRVLTSIIALPILVVALIGLWTTFGGGPPLALLFGDGSSGISHVLLMLQLIAKPIAGLILTIAPLTIVVSALLVAAGGWTWWRLLQRTPAYIPGDTT